MPLLSIFAEQSPTLPVFTSWGQVGLVVLGAVLAIKYLLPLLLKNGKSSGDGPAEWRGRMEEILATQSIALTKLAESQLNMTMLLMEIERRGRHSEEAIRTVLKEK
jgi:hypothetical protein